MKAHHGTPYAFVWMMLLCMLQQDMLLQFVYFPFPAHHSDKDRCEVFAQCENAPRKEQLQLRATTRNAQRKARERKEDEADCPNLSCVFV
jgi:hypothetical protein